MVDPPTMRIPRLVLLALSVTVAGSAHADSGPPTLGEPVQSKQTQPYPALRLTALVFDQPRPIRVWVARVDLSSPAVELVTTKRGTVGEGYETACATTPRFARKTGAVLAINASPFSPKRTTAGAGMDVVGLAACDGDVYSSPHPPFGALIVTRDGDVGIVSPPFDEAMLKSIDDAVGGFHLMIDDRADLTDRVIPLVARHFADVNPRTAVGLSRDGGTLWLIVVDGRQPGVSEGMTLSELTLFGRRLGCWDLLNMDGGGSTTMVSKDSSSDTWSVVNTPVGTGPPGTLRMVANNLGVRIRVNDEK